MSCIVFTESTSITLDLLDGCLHGSVATQSNILCSLNSNLYEIALCMYNYCRLDSNGDVKVGDFGLAEDVYSTGYFRQSDSERIKLPYKWLALESLNDAIFNEKTDVVRYLML